MKYIAIMQTANTGCYECEGEEVIKSITEWSEVSEDDFKILVKLSHKSYEWKSKIPQFKVLERPVDEGNFIFRVIADYKGLIEEEAKREAEAKRKREIANAKRLKTFEANKARVAAAKIEKLREQLAQLEAKKA